jgi:hypothetical protein
MVGTAGIEPATPAMSMQCSPAELRALEAQVYSELSHETLCIPPISVIYHKGILDDAVCPCKAIQPHLTNFTVTGL